MRSQLLRALGRLPSGAAFPETTQAMRAAFSSSALSKDSSTFFQGLQGNKEEQSQGGFKMPQLGRSTPLSFASQMHTLVKQEEEQPSAATSLAVQGAVKAPVALSALPPRPTGRAGALAAARRSMGTAAAHGDEPHYHDHAAAHPYHVLPSSKWPALSCYGALLTMLGMSGWFHQVPGCTPMMFTGLASTIVTAITWWRDCIIESDMGMHTELQKQNLMSGVWLFIVSEAALFFGLLWSCVHLGMAPNVWVQMQWPPVGIDAIGWEGRSMVMSAVLAASYYSANVAMVAKDPNVVMGALGVTVGLGALFLADQYLEYNVAPFTITDGPYGTTFFITTGFHGFHVLLGALWLAATMANYPRYNKPGVCMKGAVLYWHFVDIVWIAVYGIIYCAQL